MGNALLMGGGKQSKMTVEKLEISQIWTVPSGVKTIHGWMCGGGGGGTGRNGASGYGVSISAGNGAFTNMFTLDVTEGQEFSVIIGAGGAEGGTGGDTSFGEGSVSGASNFPYNAFTPSDNNPPQGAAFGAYQTDIKSPPSVSGWVKVSPAHLGNPGTGPGSQYSGDFTRGYCYLTGEIYCGGGSCGEMYYSDNWTTDTHTSGSVGFGVGGGGASGSFVLTPNLFVGTPGSAGIAYGAGGGAGAWLYSYGTGTQSSIGGGAGYHGVVIIGYYR